MLPFLRLLKGGTDAVQPDWNIERYVDLLKVLARRLQLDPKLRVLGDPSDLVHDTIVKALANKGQCKATTEAQRVKWLQTILRNVFRDKLRKAAKEIPNVNLGQLIDKLVMDSSARLESWLTDGEPSPSKQAMRHEFLLRLAGALQQLPADQRDVFILHRMMDTPLAKIADQLGRTHKAVAGLLRRAAERLSALLRDFGPDSQ
jgi:RNA polymerase sigma-70 factor (ECF subfamily)